MLFTIFNYPEFWDSSPPWGTESTKNYTAVLCTLLPDYEIPDRTEKMVRVAGRKFIEELSLGYKKQFNVLPEAYVMETGDGTERVN